MRRLTMLGAAMAILAACEPLPPLSEYRPVVDPKARNSHRFESDLVECRNIALKVEADYKKRQSDEFAANMLAGLVVGAVAGAVVGNNTGYQSDYIAAGAAAGAAGGVASGDYTHELVTFGPRRVVDRCMTERGHAILNDPGKG